MNGVNILKKKRIILFFDIKKIPNQLVIENN
jgi:hypothetical protein